MNDFEKALQFVLKWEGTYSKDPDDPGGETEYGISYRAHPEVNKDPNVPDVTPAAAAKVYYDEYWLKANCNVRPWPMNLVMFDTAVNCGPHVAMKWASQYVDWKDILIKRIEHYAMLAKNPKYSKFLFGWLNRIFDLWKYSGTV